MNNNRNSLLLICAALISLAFIAVNVEWILQSRIDQINDIDEAGYLSIALLDYYAWLSGGPLAWLQKIVEPSIQSPMTTAAASILFLLFRPTTFFGYIVPILFGALSVFVSYFLARRIAGERFALLTTVVVATSPTIIAYSRTFNFAMAATFCTTAAMLCLVSSQQMRSLRWSIALGFFVGLMVIARTVTIAFYPAVMLAVLWCVFSRRERLGAAFLNAVIAGIVALITAASWLAFTWRPVFEYLTRFGYGDKATSYGPAAFWQSVQTTLQYMAIYFQLFQTLLILAGVLALMIATLVAFYWNGWHKTSAAILSSPIAPLSIFVAVSTAALMSSSNKGTGFSAPLAPALLIIAIYGFRQLIPAPTLRGAGAAALALASAFAAFPLVSMAAPFYRHSQIELPVFGWIPALSSRGPIHWYLKEGGLGDPEDPTIVPEEMSRQWYEAGRTIYNRIKDKTRPDRVVMLGFRTYPLNGNTLTMFNRLDSADPLPIDNDLPFPGTVADYDKWIKARATCVLLSADGTNGDIPPPVNTPALEEAAREAGFTVFDSVFVPNGREIKLWSRPCS
ncbi:glycosyltransferase family 39 protein [Mesorhizobium sp. BR1-1-16]|uniref:ArnT family glycosyltransferase n=1 Tax=Mesorhizobium sp. BR1-1-16 TaxID=2876653 RepID=UPI001CCE48D5|nr:glycosyltransferase family 39 protein [Mesorhizobium sp. BR1-1-16]MBZ9936374.1 glycosyltransferase family 39 protein [Mesorhizobium sp. BR1-1-16]